MIVSDFEFRSVSMKCEKRRLECVGSLFCLVQEFQLTLTTGVNQTPDIHLGLGVEYPEKKSPRIEQTEQAERRKGISGIRNGRDESEKYVLCESLKQKRPHPASVQASAVVPKREVIQMSELDTSY